MVLFMAGIRACCDVLLEEGCTEEVFPLRFAEMVALGSVFGDAGMFYWTC